MREKSAIVDTWFEFKKKEVETQGDKVKQKDRNHRRRS